MPGCAYVRARGNDLGDVFRLEGAFGPGLQVDAGIGEIVHLGLGSFMGQRSGWQYGHMFSGEVLEHYLPGSLIESVRVRGYEGMHLVSWWYEQPPQHQCFLLFPYGIGDSTARREDVHVFDIEAGIHLVAFGVRAGISPGELLDFVLGFWGFDLAGDDSDWTRGHKRLYYLPNDRPPP